MRTVKLLFILVLIALLSSALLPTYAQGDKPKAVGLRPDAPPYALHGPFWVGYKSLVIGEKTANKLNVEIWYPALNPKGDKEEITYTITFKWAGDLYGKTAPNMGHAILNAPADTSNAPYPLIVFSHGFSVSATWYSTLIEHYASHGFVVIAPDHNEIYTPDMAEAWKQYLDRPRDVKQAIDFAETLTATGDMAGLIDMKRIAAVGHSSGSLTALAVAGAPYNLESLKTVCPTLSKDDPWSGTCNMILSREADLAKRAGLSSPPKGLWPSLGDSRIGAVIQMAGDNFVFDKESLSKITIPLMALSGVLDTGYERGAKPTYDAVSSAQKTLVVIEGAQHQIFSVPCKNFPWIGQMDPASYNYWCEPVWDKARGHDLINHFTTAFLLDVLKGDKEAHKALLPDAVKFVGIQYKTTTK